MREIKFRVWDKKRKFMIYEDTTPYSFEMYLDGSFCIHRYDKRSDGKKEHWYVEDSENYELMQYIGIKDKNGKEIYEGDIICVVFRDTKPFKDNYTIVVEEYGINVFHVGDWSVEEDECEVIGNIYENQELIEVD